MAKQVINVGTTGNDGTGEPIRDAFVKTNSNFTELYNAQGWGYYADGLSTPTIVIGTTFTQITIDKLGASTNENFLPHAIRGTGTLFESNKITPISVGDDHDGKLDITVTARSGSPTFMEFIIDISGGVAGTNRAFTGYLQTGGTLPYDQSLALDYYSLSTFLANGGTLYARVDSGSITIGRRNIKITRKSSGTL